jgi:hypothetical protein
VKLTHLEPMIEGRERTSCRFCGIRNRKFAKRTSSIGGREVWEFCKRADGHARACRCGRVAGPYSRIIGRVSNPYNVQESRTIMESKEIDPHPGAIFLVDYSDMYGHPPSDRATVLASYVIEAGGRLRDACSHAVVVLCKWEYLYKRERPTTTYGIFCFGAIEGVGGRLLVQPVIWAPGSGTEFPVEAEAAAMFRRAEAKGFMPTLSAGWPVEQIA